MTVHIDTKTKDLLESPSNAPDFKRHRRCCTICRHPEREAIEQAFLQWRSAYSIICDFRLPNASAVYRHAHALGLFALRTRRLRFSLENIIEKSDRIMPTGDHILRAVRALSCLDDEGKWHELPSPPSQVIFSTAAALPQPEALPAGPALLPSGRTFEADESLQIPQFLPATRQEVENAPND